MNTFVILAPAVAGVYLLWMTTLWNTHTAMAGLIYKVGPFLVGCASILASLKLGGVI